MKHVYFLIPFILVLSIRCEKEHHFVPDGLTGGFCIKVNDDHIINHYDIEYYDFSTHIVYLKSADTVLLQIGMGISFTIYANFEEIYHGATLPLYSCAMTTGPAFSQFFPDFVISIDYSHLYDSTGYAPPDPREDQRIIAALNKYNQLHAGLSCTIDTIITSPGGLMLRISVINNDSYNYYILSPDNMGIGLFHYFTNGLRITDNTTHESYGYHIRTQQPEPFDSWDKEWFYLIRRNEKKSFTLYYAQFDISPKGQYDAYFRFPGLNFQIKHKEDLTDDNGRIWLGGIDVKKSMTIK
jgi:hypothetical protein